jgi:hypothetical protein
VPVSQPKIKEIPTTRAADTKGNSQLDSTQESIEGNSRNIDPNLQAGRGNQLQARIRQEDVTNPNLDTSSLSLQQSQNLKKGVDQLPIHLRDKALAASRKAEIDAATAKTVQIKKVSAEAFFRKSKKQKEEIQKRLMLLRAGGPNWTSHGRPGPKHQAQKNQDWKRVRQNTQSGPAKYKHDVDREYIERHVWKNGYSTTTTNSPTVMEFDRIIGASNGKDSRWVRVEISSNTIHGRPISKRDFDRAIKEINEGLSNNE